MKNRSRVVAVASSVGALLALTALVAPPSVGAGYAPGTVAFTFRDGDIGESSGVVASTYRDDVVFTHNDSGDKGRFFAIDDQGCTLARYNLVGLDTQAFRDDNDVEDMAKGEHAGQRVIWLADIGDNTHQRSEIAVYRIVEPKVNASSNRSSTGCPTPAEEAVQFQTFRLAYPDTPHDAETLLADPDGGQLYIVTKTPLGQSSVYAAPAPNDLTTEGTNDLTLVASIVFPPSTTYDNDPATYPPGILGAPPQQPYLVPAFDVAGRVMAVGGDIAPDRSRLVVRTYTDAWEWDLGEGSIGDALLAVPRQIPLEYQRQGEAIAYTADGVSLLTTCEDVGCPAHLYRGA